MPTCARLWKVEIRSIWDGSNDLGPGLNLVLAAAVLLFIGCCWGAKLAHRQGFSAETTRTLDESKQGAILGKGTTTKKSGSSSGANEISGIARTLWKGFLKQ